MKENPESVLELTIRDLSRGGAGVAREESGRAIFVPFTAPGDRVRAKIVEEDRRYAQARLLEILEPSTDRVNPPCAVFGRCGGCQWQHLPYAKQWKTKVEGVARSLERAGVTLKVPFEELPAEKIWGYRNRIQLRGSGEILGYYAPSSHDLIPIERCEIADFRINQAIPEIRAQGAKFGRPYKVEIEVPLGDGPATPVWNAPNSASGFRQVHDEQNEKLKNWVAAQLTAGRALLDLFGGAGNLSLGVASRMTKVDCVDVSVPRNNPPGTPANFHFHASAVMPWLQREASRRPNRANRMAPLVSAVIDPPREGLGRDFFETESNLQKLGVTEAVFVGCDVDAWTRDVSRFVGKGWRLEKSAVLDLFPQTVHVESIALLYFDTK